jgi:peptide/nickel transport system permease protein
MLDVLSLDYISTARAKGLPERRVVLKHALRNCATPIISTIAFTLVIIMAQAVVTESVFALPGIGRLVINSVLRRDYPVLQGVLLLTASLYLFINLFADIAYGLLDPRIRY